MTWRDRIKPGDLESLWMGIAPKLHPCDVERALAVIQWTQKFRLGAPPHIRDGEPETKKLEEPFLEIVGPRWRPRMSDDERVSLCLELDHAGIPLGSNLQRKERREVKDYNSKHSRPRKGSDDKPVHTWTDALEHGFRRAVLRALSRAAERYADMVH